MHGIGLDGMGLAWIALHRIAFDWLTLVCIGLHWVALHYIGLHWIGWSSSGLFWKLLIGYDRIRLDCVVLDSVCVSADWVALD